MEKKDFHLKFSLRIWMKTCFFCLVTSFFFWESVMVNENGVEKVAFELLMMTMMNTKMTNNELGENEMLTTMMKMKVGGNDLKIGMVENVIHFHLHFHQTVSCLNRISTLKTTYSIGLMDCFLPTEVRFLFHRFSVLSLRKMHLLHHVHLQIQQRHIL